MAAVTISASANLDDRIFDALNSGDLITINNGAILTINSDCLATTSSLGGPQNVELGSITINDGQVLFDSTRTRLIPFAGFSGSTPFTANSTVWQLSGSGTNTSGSIIAVYFNSGSTTTGTIKCRSLSGTLVSQSLLYFGSASFTSSATASSPDTVGWLAIAMRESATVTTTRQATFKVTGSWMDIGIGTGLAPQYLTGSIGKYIFAGTNVNSSPPQGSIPAIWVESASGSNVFNPWINLTATGTALSPNDTASLDGTPDPRGWTYVHLNTTSFITCSFGGPGNTRQGFTIPTGSRVRTPNIHFIGTATAARNTSSINATIGTWPDFTTTAAGTIDIDCMLGTAFYLSLSQPYQVTLKNSGFQGQLSITEVGDSTYMENVAVGRAQGLTTATAVVFTGNYGSTTVKNCFINGQAPVANSATAGNTFLITSCKNVLFTSSIMQAYGKTGTTGVGMTINNTAGLTFTSCSIIGALTRISQFSSDVTLNNNRYISHNTASAAAVGSDAIANPAWDFLQTSNILIDGEQRNFRGADHAYAGMYRFTSCDGIEIKNIGTREQPYNLGVWLTGSATASITPRVGYPFVLVNYNLNTKISRCYFTQSRTGFMSTNNSNDTLFMQNCMSDQGDTLQPIARNVFCRGMALSDGVTGATGVVNGTSLVAVYGTQFFDCFRVDNPTTGSFGIVATEMNTADPFSSGSYEISGSNSITGSPEFNSNGGLLMRESQSYVIWTWPTFIKGHVGFLNLPVRISGSNQQSASSIEYQLDKGSGFPGTWTSASAANLAAETGITASVGFRPKIKAICRLTHPANNLQGITFFTSTSLSNQATSSLYAIDSNYATLTLEGLMTGSEIRVYNSASGAEIAGVESSGTSFDYTYLWEGSDIIINLVILNLYYEYIRYTGLTLGQSGLTVPVQQRFDRNYRNPA